jgi:5-formyltetrahydrofolate cyclo-ligase
VSTPARVKGQLRSRLLAARRAVPHAVREAEAEALAAAPLPGLPGLVCAYWPIGTEPGSAALLTGLQRRGCRVLLPVIAPVGPLNWAEYSGGDSLRAGPHGVGEPLGPLLGCPAIAGVRLGRGGGHYDQTLPLATPGTPLIAVVRDEEVLDSVPAEAHDVLVTAALTPGRGLFPLPCPSPAQRSGRQP